jgi:hypothetical protein
VRSGIHAADVLSPKNAYTHMTTMPAIIAAISAWLTRRQGDRRSSSRVGASSPGSGAGPGMPGSSSRGGASVGGMRATVPPADVRGPTAAPAMDGHGRFRRARLGGRDLRMCRGEAGHATPDPCPLERPVTGSAILDDLLRRELVHDSTDLDELRRRLDEGPITVYAGFDPTAESLHLGNLIPLLLLRRFQLHGHRPLALAGGATGMVGDPGGRSEERKLLDGPTLDRHLAGIKVQLRRLLDFDVADNPAKLGTTATGRSPSGSSISSVTWASTSP